MYLPQKIYPIFWSSRRFLSQQKSAEKVGRPPGFGKQTNPWKSSFPRWWFHFFIFTPTWGNDPIWWPHFFKWGWFNHQLVSAFRRFFVAGPRPRGKASVLEIRQIWAISMKRWEENSKVFCFVSAKSNWLVVSNVFGFHPYLGKIPILTYIFSDGFGSTTN